MAGWGWVDEGGCGSVWVCVIRVGEWVGYKDSFKA